MDSAMTTMMIPELTGSPTAPAKTAATTRIATRGQAAQNPVHTARTMSADERIAAVSREAACCFVRVETRFRGGEPIKKETRLLQPKTPEAGR